MPPARRTPLSPAEIERRLAALGAPWEVRGNALRGEWRFKNFAQTESLVRAVLEIANRENHHPEAEFGFNYCRVLYTTHSAKALTALDFDCAESIKSAADKNAER
ncbi:MAG: 4a-hydroxytetrahydrobiopterin dehydratase [Gammaproteobacteria bacterium]